MPSAGSRGVNSDFEIFDLVLSDLIVNEDFNPAVGGRRVRKSQIVLESSTHGLTERGLYHPTDGYANAIPADIRHDILTRNPKGRRYSLAGYRPSSTNFLVRVLSDVDLDEKFDESFPDARGFIRPNLPGYSKDGKSAMFFFTFGPTSHGATGYYMLVRIHDAWKISWRTFNYFT